MLTGPPGAGKSTVARLLADELSPSVHLHTDDFYRFIRRGAVAPYLPEAQRQNETVMEVLSGSAFGYAGGGYDVVVDGVIGPWFLDVFRKAGAGFAVHYVVLRPNEAITIGRAVDRGPGALTEVAPIRSLYKQFSELGELERHVVDSGSMDAEDTTTAVLAGIARGAYRLAED